MRSVLFLDLTVKSSKQAVDTVGRIADEKESITVPVRMKVLSHSENGEHMPDLGLGLEKAQEQQYVTVIPRLHTDFFVERTIWLRIEAEVQFEDYHQSL
ncbi:hypothetical protein CapIbe_003712 [Capra ibex]